MKPTQKNRPSFAVYAVEGEGDTAFWTKIGAAWSHEDGKGYGITLSCLPVNGRLVLREPKPNEQSGE